MELAADVTANSAALHSPLHNVKMACTAYKATARMIRYGRSNARQDVNRRGYLQISLPSVGLPYLQR